MSSQKKLEKKQLSLNSFFGNNASKVPAKPATTKQEPAVAKQEPAKTASASTDTTEQKKRKRVIISDTEEEDEEEAPPKPKTQKTALDQSAVEPVKQETSSSAPKTEVMEIDDQGKKLEHSDEDFDKEIEEAAAEEKEAKKEKLEMMSIIHTIASVGPGKSSMDWKKGAPVPYSVLCETFEKCENTTKRLEITEHLVVLFVKVIELTPDGLLQLLYMCINKLCPDYEGLELGIGESLLMKAVAQSTGRDMKQLKLDYVKCGDLGTVAMNSKGSQRTLFKPKPLTVPHVFSTLKEIAKITGNSAQSRKVDKIKGLLVACQDEEAKFIIRHLEGKLRIGLAEQTVLSALAQAVVLTNSKMSTSKKEELLSTAVDTVKYVYNQLPSYDIIIPALLKYPLDELMDHCTMHPGIPLKPMLAHPTKSLTEVLDRFEGQTFTCEFKYDGERAQIHRLEDGTINVYSRNSENMSVRYPDIMNAINKWIKPTTTSFILDCEAVAWDKQESKILPFQVLSTRKRKDVKEEEITVRVAVFAFDCLYLNGESLLQKSLKERRKALAGAFQETEHEFYFAKHMDSNNIEDIQAFLDVSITSNCEGLMVKAFDGAEATYEPSKRSRNWLKVKKDYLNGVGDSMDLVVVGAYYGRGKRTSVYGAFLLACYDPETEEFQTICKIGTGFSDENLQLFYDTLKDHVIDAPKQYYCLGENAVKPDIWFAPTQVWEVKCADLSVSPRYMAGVGRVDPNKGISLRFPRFIRVRDDKDPENATSSEQISEFYFDQANQQGNSKNNDMDYY
ncbi:DNA ligase [Mucor ambiguus]|uniref:DNA ligase n=1 Tax=Mucor ambiguus TaxID=91626 RepID=A0A0C9MQ52_9FUNG|nr:DNA ligase [Mucor ambiguus]